MTNEAQAYWAKTLKAMTGTATWKDSLAKLQWVDAYADSDAFASFLVDEYKSYQDLMKDLGLSK